MRELKALSDAATQGVWVLNDLTMSVCSDNGEGVCVMIRSCDNHDANRRFIAAAVNGIRNGTLVDAKQARRDALQEAVDVCLRGDIIKADSAAAHLTALMEADT